MKKIILFLVAITLHYLNANAFIGDITGNKLLCTPTITTGSVANITICAGTVISVPYTFVDCVDPANVFSVQLSDSGGSFTSPITIGNLVSVTSGVINATIPSNTIFGSHYRVRVVSSSPSTNGTDNGTDLVLLQKPNASFTINNSNQCFVGNSFTYTNTSTGSISGFNWSLGDGISTNQTSVVYSYSNNGNYTVKLVANATNGCKDSSLQNVNVFAKPTVNFTINKDTQCSGANFILTNTSTIGSGTQSFLWNLGDATSSSSTNVTKNYTAGGSYNIKLVSTSNNGCKDSLSKTITVLNKPTSLFTVNNIGQCLSSNNFIFTNNSTGTIVNSDWSFGDGSISVLTNPTKFYTTAGTYITKLVSTNLNGCKDSLTQTINVFANATPSFNVVGSTNCASNLGITLNNTSTGIGNSYLWKFGDGTTSSIINPTKSYTTAGAYIIRLVVTSSNGCVDSTEQSITFSAKPTAAFSINTNSLCENEGSFIFTNNTTGTNNYLWSFGDGITSTLANPSKAYSIAGSYSVKLVVTNSIGCKDSISQTITVLAKPIVNFSIPGAAICSSSLTVSLTNTSISSGANYSWDFGDGTTSTATNPTKTYSVVGNYTIKLVVTNGNGCKDSLSKSIVINASPIAAFTSNSSTQCLSGNSFTFTNTSTGTGLTYNWNFGDGITSTLQNPSKTYATSGTYTVKLIITNTNGCKDSVSQVINVLTKPTTNFSISGTTGCSSNLTIQLTNLSSGNSPSYSWDFGDGTSSTATNPSKTYLAAGNYTVKLVVTNSNGCKDSLSTSFTLVQKPVADFTINNSSQCVNNNTFTYTNASIGASSYSWSFGDGFTSIVTNPTKQYTATGTYTVKLVATNSTGCKDSISKTITIVPKPTAIFTTSGATGCTNNRTISLSNSSTGTGNTYSWDFGDGNTSTATNPNTTYTAAGTYTIKLVVTNINGCKDSTSQIITFNPFPVSAISLAGSTTATQCFNGNSFAFNGNPTSGVTYNWSFGDGGISTIANPTKSYSSVGNYTVKLVVTNSSGCKDSATRLVTVVISPTASYTYLGNTGCTTNRTLNFTNTSTGAATYLWSFGDNTGTTSISPSKTYATTSGTYNVQLLAINIFGCRDSVTQIVSFKSQPTTTIAFAGNNTQCVNSNAFLFVDNSINASNYSWNFGDGTTSSFKDPSVKVYTVAGNYTVKHFATSSDGCIDSTTLNINILAAPAPNFNISGLDFCGNNLPLTFNNTSTGTGNTYLWRFGDGTTSTSTSPTKTYTVTGSYTVRLIVTSANGCTDSVTQIVQFAPKATANFSLNSGTSIRCLRGTNFSLLNTSPNTTSGKTYLWTYGNGTNSTLVNLNLLLELTV